MISGLSNGYCGKNAEVIKAAIKVLQVNRTNFFDKKYYIDWQNEKIDFNNPSSLLIDNKLNPVDIKIIALSCEGKTSKEIASELKLSSRTIDTYSSFILEKLGLRNKVELVQFAILNGICIRKCANYQSGLCTRRSIF